MSIENLLRQSGFTYSEQAVVNRLARQLKREEYSSLRDRLSFLYRYCDVWPREDRSLFLTWLPQDGEHFLSVVTVLGEHIAGINLAYLTPCT